MKPKTKSIASTPTPEPSDWVTIVPELLWFLLAVVVLFGLRRRIARLADVLAERLASGASVRLGGLELGEVPRANSTHAGMEGNHGLDVTVDDGTLGRIRSDAYDRARGVMVVHRIMRSRDPKQVFDALLYMVPRKGSSTLGVQSVSYFFGKYWGNKVFTTTDRARGFPLLVSAYGPFLAVAKLKFADGEEGFVERFIDFEMGDVAPQTSKRGGASKRSDKA